MMTLTVPSAFRGKLARSADTLLCPFAAGTLGAAFELSVIGARTRIATKARRKNRSQLELSSATELFFSNLMVCLTPEVLLKRVFKATARNPIQLTPQLSRHA